MTTNEAAQAAETIANLNRLLEIERSNVAERDGRIVELEQKVENQERYMDTSLFGWNRHRPWKADDLPVPRLEMRWTHTGDGEAVALQVLVYRHFLDQIEAIPIGQTRCSNMAYRNHGDNRPMFHGWEERGELLDLPFRDGSHIRHNALHLGLRAFVTTDRGDVTEINLLTRQQTWVRRNLLAPEQSSDTAMGGGR